MLASGLRLQGLPTLCRYSIHGPSDAKAEQRAAEESFPRLIQGTDSCYHCGFHDGAQGQSGALPVDLWHSKAWKHEANACTYGEKQI